MSYSPVNYLAYPRSTLASLEPFNCGTWQVESLYSYVERLLASHGIPRRHFESFVNGTLASASLSHGLPAPMAMDNIRVGCQAFASRLADLTMRREVARLGLGWLSGVIPQFGIIRPESAWCRHCLMDSFKGRRPAYLPMLWSIRAVEVCLIHGTRLSSTCGNCRAHIKGNAAWPVPFYCCPKCTQPLHSNGAGSSSGKESRPSAQQTWEAEQIANLIERLQYSESQAEPAAPDIDGVIRSSMARGLCSGVNDFAHRARLSKSTLTAMRAGGRVTLSTWLRVSLAADVSLVGLFAPTLWKDTIHGGDIAWCLTTRHRRRRDWDAIRRDVRRRLDSGRVLNVRELARELAACPKQCKAQLGELARELNEATKRRKQAAFDAKSQALAEILKKEAFRFLRAGAPASVRALALRVGLDRCTPLFQQALRLAGGRELVLGGRGGTKTGRHAKR
jgi:hypothetical protein